MRMPRPIPEWTLMLIIFGIVERKSPLAQYRKVCFIFHENRNAEDFLKSGSEIYTAKGIIGSENGLVFVNHSVKADADTGNAAGHRRQFIQGLADDFHKKLKNPLLFCIVGILAQTAVGAS